MINGRVCSLRLDFQGIHNKGDLVHKSVTGIKERRKEGQVSNNEKRKRRAVRIVNSMDEPIEE